jgi:hypothetical protein
VWLVWQEREASKEALVFLIDAQPSMFKEAGIADKVRCAIIFSVLCNGFAVVRRCYCSLLSLTELSVLGLHDQQHVVPSGGKGGRKHLEDKNYKLR